MAGWQFLTGDVKFTEYGGSWFRGIAPDVYHVIELGNWEDWIGQDAEGGPTYNVSLKEIDLSVIDPSAAMASWGMPPDSQWDKRAIVDACASYGNYAPLGDWNGNNYRQLLRTAKRESKRLERDARYREDRLMRPVNKIGSTALEFAQGDFVSGMLRSIASGSQEARIVGKIYGLSDSDLDTIEREGWF